jgi:uncharacterized protein (TIGR03083 family)
VNDFRAPGWRLVFEERDDILDFFRDLTPDQWEMPSLCQGWRIKDVAVHLLVDEPVLRGMFMRALPLLAREGFSVDRVNSRWVDQNRGRSPASIVESFQQDSVKGVGVIGHLLGPDVALRALVIHHQDMRRPLHLARRVPAERLVAALDALLTWKGNISIGSRSRAKGLRLRAVDVAWSHGAGPEVIGPGEAIVLALAGRPVALGDLQGEGKAVLAKRIASQDPPVTYRP